MSDTPRLVDAKRTIVDKPQDRGEWLATRHSWFNASAAAILWNRHPYLTPGDYATIKLTGDEQPPTRAMKRGTRLEDPIAQWWAEEERCEVMEPRVLFTAGRIMATVDRLVVVTRGSSVSVGTPVEIKTIASHSSRPEQYWLDQCQAIMLCKGAPEMVLVWFDSSLDIRDEVIKADPDQQEAMLARADRFMAAIDLGFAPDWVMLTASNLATIYDKPADMADLDDDGLNLVRELAALRQIRHDCDHDEVKVKDKLAHLLRDKEAAAYMGIPVLSWKAVKAARKFDVERFHDEHPEMYDEYLVDGRPSRRFHVMPDLLTGVNP